MLDPKDISTISDMVSGVGNLIQASAWSRIKTALEESQKTPTNKQKFQCLCDPIMIRKKPHGLLIMSKRCPQHKHLLKA